MYEIRVGFLEAEEEGVANCRGVQKHPAEAAQGNCDSEEESCLAGVSELRGHPLVRVLAGQRGRPSTRIDVGGVDFIAPHPGEGGVLGEV